MKILLIEDNELNMDMLKRRLERNGYIIICASDGESGYNLAKENKHDIIIMDLSLPLIDGWTLASMIKSNSTILNKPIIALTAHAMKGDKDKALQAGCDDYDTKPVDLERLLNKINILTSKTINEQ